ncbi:MAG: hypothetical protein R2798_12475 [Chitinophagales bacterium]|nr:hypothetical protein [Bacteroidota bacterium]MCB9043064.1 hypothetical protein [Chitinophagales bacterium]
MPQPARSIITSAPKAYSSILAIMFLVIIFVFCNMDYGHNWWCDFALYILQAKAIAAGTSLQEIYEWNKISMENSDIHLVLISIPMGFRLF